MTTLTPERPWQFWIDRGGTFTDIVARQPDGSLVVHKLLSENPDRYQDAPIQGIRELMGLSATDPIPAEQIEVVKMGTTVATNALLERRGDPTVLVITQGFGDALRIGYQNRPNLFARQIVLPEVLYTQVIEVAERYSAQGEELLPVNREATRQDLAAAYSQGIRACAIVFLHGYRYPDHERQVATLAQEIGFEQISLSHQVSPLMKLVSRGDTTVVDAYLSPLLRRYVQQVAGELGSTRLLFMQSNGGLADAHHFQGKDSLLSGPAGGIVGAVQTSIRAGFSHIISFDMGGTSTDVAHYNGTYERAFETEIAGVRLRAPIMAIHTVAAGGGSILGFDGSRYRVGPGSAGAYPGPTSYRHGGPLTVTDCNVQLGKLQPEFFPHVFGQAGNLPLDGTMVQEKFAALSQTIHLATRDRRSPEAVAAGFLAIAVEKMAQAIKKISLERGHDVSTYTLCCFGGAGGQHACLIAEALGMSQVLIHPYAGVLSAYGMGLADLRVFREQAVEATLTEALIPQLESPLITLATAATQELQDQGLGVDQTTVCRQANLRYTGTDTPLLVDFGSLPAMQTAFEAAHRQRYGFISPEKSLILESLVVEVIGHTVLPPETDFPHPRSGPLSPRSTVPMYSADSWQATPVFHRQDLQPGDCLVGPAMIVETTATTIVEAHWQAQVTERLELILTHQKPPLPEIGTVNLAELPPDPVQLEIFNHLFRGTAEHMGVVLQNTAASVNIKERLDFSCAIFDGSGQLVANAPHIPVHLGSMGDSVQALLSGHGSELQPGDVFAANNPYNGGTHLPDITVITPVFPDATLGNRPLFFVASRGHHGDIGGITPGSMPPNSTSVTEEGILLDNFPLVTQGCFREVELREQLSQGPYPARNPNQNVADLKAQIAANEKGVQALQDLVQQFGLATVQAYMGHIQTNAAQAVERAIVTLCGGHPLERTFTYPLDSGAQIQVTVSLIPGPPPRATIDFTGTSPQLSSNFNAPAAVCTAAILYVFRTLVADDIPLNAGCLQPLEIKIPPGSCLNPHYPAAVVAGNVETSQAIANALYGALGLMAAAQGTMNNLTFGNDRYQYYETLCGGAGAGTDFDGTDAVHTHMTNSRLTDPEVLEWRFPVRIESFAIRPQSGGKGRHQGGNGVSRRIYFREAMTAAILSSHRRVPPFGLAGGDPGKVGVNQVERVQGTLETLAGTATMTMAPGDVLIIETPGGGGYGAS